MVFPGANGSLGDVGSMLVGRCVLERGIVVGDKVFNILGCFVV